MKRIEVMNRAKFIKQGEKMIFLFDFSGLAVDDGREVSEYGKGVIARMPKNSVLTLTDVTNVVYDDTFNALAKELTAHNKGHVRAGAVVGVSGWRKLAFWAALKFSGRDNLKLFATVEDAKGWLVGYS